MSKYKVSPANERQYLGRTFGSKQRWSTERCSRTLSRLARSWTTFDSPVSGLAYLRTCTFQTSL